MGLDFTADVQDSELNYRRYYDVRIPTCLSDARADIRQALWEEYKRAANKEEFVKMLVTHYCIKYLQERPEHKEEWTEMLRCRDYFPWS